MSTLNAEYESLLIAIRYLAARCDGAVSQDGMGFNGHDTKFGRRVAAMNLDEWTPEIIADVSSILPTYSKQLAAGGIKVNELPLVKGEIDSNTRYTARQQARQNEYNKKNAPFITIEGNLVKVWNSYPIKDQLKSNGFTFGRHGTRTWDSELTPQAASTILGLGIELENGELDSITKLAAQYNPEEKPQAFNITLASPNRVAIATEFNQVPLAVIRAMPGRNWDGKLRVNFADAHIALLRIAEEYNLSISPEAMEAIEANRAKNEADIAAAKERVAESLATDTDMVVPLADHLYPFQKAGAAYGIKHRRVLIGDEMGLGKTRQSLSIMMHFNAFPLLVICPPNLKLNWESEIVNLLPDELTVETIFTKARGPREFTADITIMGYPAVESYLEYMPQWAGLIIDESHYVKNEKAARTIAVLELCGKKFEEGHPIPGKLAPNAPIAFLTGTPILNRPIELVQPLVCLGYLSPRKGMAASADSMMTVGQFKYRYCNPQQGYGKHVTFKGSSNELELNENLRKWCMVRRTKKDVLTELPPKIRVPLFIALSQSAMATYSKLAREGAERAAQTRAEAIVYLNALRNAAGVSKINQAIEWIDDFLETGKSLIVFADHIKVQKEIIRILQEKDVKVSYILGGQNNKLTEEMKRQFQANETQVIVCSFGAAREGHTLTAASDVLFVEMGWNPGTHNQAEDRAHRIGQRDSVTAYWLTAQETIDEDTWELIEEKRKIVNAVTDGVMAAEIEDSIFNELLDRTLAQHGVSRRF